MSHTEGMLVNCRPNGPYPLSVKTEGGTIIAEIRDTFDVDGVAEANRDRVRDSWNACSGVANLAPGCVAELIEALQVAKSNLLVAVQRDCTVPGFDPHDHSTIARITAILSKVGANV